MDPRRIMSDYTRPARALRAVTPNDDSDLPAGVCRSLWVNDAEGGDVEIIAEGDTDAVVVSIAGPGLIPVAAKRVKDGNTTATSIVAFY